MADHAWQDYILACQSRGLIRRDGAWTLPEPTTDDPAAEINKIAELSFLDGRTVIEA